MFLSTILPEPHRWKRDMPPGFQWNAATGATLCTMGFSGIELWEGHFAAADTTTRELLRTSPCPVRIFNWYGSAGGPGEEIAREAAGFFSRTLRGIKFNLGADPARRDGEIDAVARLARSLPGSVRLLCEFHSGSSVDTPGAAAAALERWPDSVGAILHPFCGESCAEWHAALRGRVHHLHLQLREGDRWGDPVPGKPAVDHGTGILRRQSFRATASLEFVAAVSRQAEPDVLLSEAARVRAAWAQCDEPWQR